MNVKLQFFGQAKLFAGSESVTVEAMSGCTVNDVLASFLNESNEKLHALLLDDKNCLRSNILATVNDELVDPSKPGDLKDNDTIIFYPALAGG